MLVEMGVVGGGYYIYKKTKEYIKDRDLREMKEVFRDIMLKAGVHNHVEQQNTNSKTKQPSKKETYSIYNIKRMKYGYFALIKIPNGLGFDKLQSLKYIIQSNMRCLVEFEEEVANNLIKTKFIYSPQNNKDFKPVKTKPNELFLGYLPDGKPFKLNLNKDPHILIAGKTGTGKSFLFASILTNLIHNHKKDIEVYLFQIMKGEIDIFKKCPTVKFTSDNKDEILIMLEKLYKKMHERSKKFADMGIKNITQWNKHFPKKRMKRIIIGVEEISFFMNEASNSNDKDGKKEKDPTFEYFTGIVKAGRSVGIHFICITQRTTAKNLGGDGELKSQMCVLTGQQKSETDSKNAIDIKDAIYLKQQEYIYAGNEGYVWFRSPNIDEDYDILAEYVPEIVTPSKMIKQNVQDNVLICTKSEWIPLDEYNKRKQIEEVKSIKSNPIPPKKTKRKNVIPINRNGSDDVANY